MDLLNSRKRRGAHLRFLREQIHNRYDVKARLELGLYDLRLGNYREALRLFQEALETDAENADLHFYLGIAFQKLHQLNAAADEFKTCLRLKKDYGSGQALLKLGDVYRSQHDYSSALTYYLQMLTINPYEGEALYKIGFTNYLQGSYKEARRYLTQAITEIKALPKFRYKKDRIWLYKAALLKILLIGRTG
jgi:tetratricopeptide (TPR) repeat protein